MDLFSPQLITSVVTALLMTGLMLTACAYLILLERKIAAWTQDRIGPNRVGLGIIEEALPFVKLPSFLRTFWGLGQPAADGIKLLFKEDYTPPGVEKTLFILAPVIGMFPALLAWAVIPWGGTLVWGESIVSTAVAPVGNGIIFVLAMGSLGVYNVVLGGFASNNKYAFLGGLRATAQMLSYEIPMALCVLVLLMTAGTSRVDEIINLQTVHGWNLFAHPLLAVIFYTCVLAECNRAPFDLAEAEQELVGGYHTEYSSMKWALFFLAEYCHMITGCAIFVALFLGGWDAIPFAKFVPLEGGLWLVALKVAIFLGKTFVLLALMMLIRWTLPRLRFDQLMKLAWRALIPMTLGVVLLYSILLYAVAHDDRRWWMSLAINAGVFIFAAIAGPMLPAGPAVNRRVGLVGSRFSPPKTTEA